MEENKVALEERVQALELEVEILVDTGKTLRKQNDALVSKVREMLDIINVITVRQARTLSIISSAGKVAEAEFKGMVTPETTKVPTFKVVIRGEHDADSQEDIPWTAAILNEEGGVDFPDETISESLGAPLTLQVRDALVEGKFLVGETAYITMSKDGERDLTQEEIDEATAAQAAEATSE